MIWFEKPPAQQWQLRRNPAYRGKPRRLKSSCHDKTPFLSITHRCGGELHMHESQVRPIDPDAVIVAVCPACHEVLEFDASFVQHAFDEMRREGWI